MRIIEILKKEFIAFSLTFSFFSRISIIKAENFEEFPNSVKYIPIFSLISGGLLFCLLKVADFFLPSPLPQILIFTLQYFLFNYFHFDGFLDSIDGFLGGKNKTEILRIMEDTQVGSFAVLFGSIYISSKLFLYSQILAKSPEIIIFIFFIGRLSFIFSAFLVPYPAKDKGLGHIFISIGRNRLFVPLAFIILPLYFYPIETFSSLFFTFLLSWYIRRKIGGVTGDVLGAICEISELIWAIGYFSLHW